MINNVVLAINYILYEYLVGVGSKHGLPDKTQRADFSRVADAVRSGLVGRSVRVQSVELQ